jgi:hypothetical protein
MSNTNTTREIKRGRPATSDTVSTSKRPKRIPMSGSRMKMQLDEEFLDSENYHYAWINDQKGLLYDAKRAGYEHVTTDEIPSWGQRNVDTANANSSVVSMPVGQGVVAFLMKQPMEFHKEDVAEGDKLWQSREADMKKELNSGTEGRYGKVDIGRN